MLLSEVPASSRPKTSRNDAAGTELKAPDRGRRVGSFLRLGGGGGGYLTAQSSRRLTAVIVAIAAVGTAWILVQTYHGACVTSDSVFYLSAAENLAAGKGLVGFRGNELYWFPPGYSISLAGFELAGIGAQEGGRYLNAVLFGATILISGLWLKTLCRSGTVVLAGVLTTASTKTFYHSAGCLHSEPLYLLLTLSSLILVSEAVKHDRAGRRTQWMLLAAGLLSGLSVATRYVGIVTTVSSFLLLLFWRPSRTALRTRLQAATMFGLAASLPVVAVLIRNLAGTGRLLADRLYDSTGRTGHSMLDAIETIIRFHFIRFQVHPTFTISHPTFAIGWIMLFTAVLAYWVAGGRPTPHPPPPPPLARHRAQRPISGICSALCRHPRPYSAMELRTGCPSSLYAGCDCLGLRGLRVTGRSNQTQQPLEGTTRAKAEPSVGLHGRYNRSRAGCFVLRQREQSALRARSGPSRRRRCRRNC